MKKNTRTWKMPWVKYNQWIEDIGIPNHKKNVLKAYAWKIMSGDKNECKVVKGEQLFYTKEDALLEGCTRVCIA